ncbi:MAG: Long-chain-fatty-acid--CoA ligase [Solirubrobacterales bacterium]|jgi:long-chain acyl-CoA synthetase|nr:Long-chain-fatty-acid--CoA ligase [Solirubrobacterales bacterium]
MTTDPYTARPWEALLGAATPRAITPGHDHALGMLAAAVTRAPDRVALRFATHDGSGGGANGDEGALTFAQVDARSDALAAGLHELGVGAGDRVAAQLQNVALYPLTCLALWKLGAAGVSVNAMYREREIGHLVGDSGAVALISDEPAAVGALAGVGGSAPRARITTADLTALVEAHRGAAPPARPPLHGAELAMLTYTSGTTGRPKGAMTSHANLTFSAEAYTRFFSIAGDDEVLLAIAPFFHVTGLVAGIGAWLSTAATMVLPYRFDPALALELIERHRVTWTVGATTAFVALMNAPGADAADLSSLRRVLSGGAPIPPSVVDEFARRFGTPIVPGYGMTETTVCSHGVPPDRRPPVHPESGALSVGVPMVQTQARIVDDHGAVVGVGEIGELQVRGPSVIDGYWRDPAATAAAFDGDWLRTGDIASMDAEGWFYLMDRKRDMIIASGYKVWPREVEDVLYEHPAVLEAAVVGAPDAYRGETVVAHVAPRPGMEVTEAELVAHCRALLAAYKVPRSVQLRATLPKTASGKILRRELRGE